MQKNKKKLISMYVNKEDWDKIKVLSSFQNITSSELVRKLISIYIEKATKK